MAEQKNNKSTKSTKTTTKTTTTKKSNNSSWGINKISFYAIGAVAILYLISTILGLMGVNLKIVSVLEAFATAIIICITAVLAWRYVSHKQTVWKVLYFVLLLVVLIGVVIPLVI